MMNLVKITAITPFIFLLGCAQSLKIDAPQADYNPALQNKIIKLDKITVLNKAKDGILNGKLFGDMPVPIRTVNPTRNLLEDDITGFLNHRFNIVKGSNRSLNVIIYKADSYWVRSAAMSIPFVGIAASFDDTEIGLNLKFTIEVEQNGKVSKTYTYDDVITIQGKVSTEEALKTSYYQLIDEYRKVLFKELNSNFISRYM